MTVRRSLPSFAPHVSRFTFHALFAATIILSPIHRFKVIEARPLDLVYDDYIDFQFYVADLPLLAAVTLWCLSFLWYRRPVASGSRWIVLPFAGVWIAGLVGAPWSADPGLSLHHLARLAILGVFALAVAEFGSLRELAGASTLMIGVQSLVGLRQWVEQHSLGLIAYGERVLDPAKLGTSVVLGGDTRLLRAYGLADHPNLLGGCLAFGLVLIGGALLEARSARTTVSRTMVTVLLVVSLAVGAATLIVTFSRSAWIGLAIGFVVLYALHWLARRPLRVLLLPSVGLAIGLIAILPAVLPAFTVRLQAPDGSPRTEERSVEGRSNLTRAATDLIRSRPLLGVGLGTFPIAHLRRDPDFPDNFVPVHNIVLAATAEIGLPGGAFYLTLLAAPFVLTLRAGRSVSPLRAAATAGLAAIVVVGMLDYYPWLLVPGRLWYFTLLGLWAGGRGTGG